MTQSMPAGQERMRISTPASMVEAVPHLLGFKPTESVIFLGLGPGRAPHVLLTARTDLYDTLDAAPKVADALRAAGCDRVALLVALDHLDGDPRTDPKLIDLGDELRAQLGALLVIEYLVYTDERFWGMMCQSAGCCPPEGTERIGGVPEAILAGLPPAASSRDEYVKRLAPLAALRSAQAEQLIRRLGNIPARDDKRRPTWQAAANRAVWAMCRELAAGRGEFPFARLVTFAVALTDPEVRDELWMHIDERDELAEQAGELARLVAVTFAPHGCAAAGYFLYAWLAWRKGDGLLSRAANARALECDPQYGPAPGLMLLLDMAVDPRRFPPLRGGPLMPAPGNALQPAPDGAVEQGGV